MNDRFHTDRINNFCDAVFAIAMTLLILEIKVPNHEQMESIGLVGSLKHLIPSFVGFLISFLVTGLYWRAHLSIAKYAKSYDNRQLWLTIWLLLFIVLLPFSTALYSEYFNYNHSFIFYCANLVLIGLFHFLLVSSIIRKEGFTGELTPDIARWIKIRSLMAPAIWALSIVWVFIEPLSARFVFISIFVIQMFVDRKFRKKLAV
jgi:uncharacterized membrane protein